jgi:NADPH-dependent 2,4-dienoyl-CoA reductase/sulfur reductase-like enzyme
MLTPAAILEATQISPSAPVYALVPKFGPVSFYSQQKRAYNLVSALRLAGKLPSGTTVAVVGAGLAGITASAAAHMLGCKVTLFESNEARFHQQHGNHTRFIHPNVIEWPRQSWMAAETQLPFLNWAAGECAGIIDDIEEQWQALGVELKTRLPVQVRDLVKDGACVTASHPF